MGRKSAAAVRAAAASAKHAAAAKRKRSEAQASTSEPALVHQEVVETHSDPDWQPGAESEHASSDMDWADSTRVGDDCDRERARKRKRLSRERLRNVELSAQSINFFFEPSICRAVKAVAEAACQAVVEAARQADRNTEIKKKIKISTKSWS